MANNSSLFNFTSLAPINATTPTNVIGPLLSCDKYTENPGQITYAVFLVLVLLFCVLGNSLVCIAIGMSPRLRETPTNYFIISLAVSDIFYAVSQCPIRISTILHSQVFCFNVSVCQYFILTDLISTPAMISTLFVIAIDRCFCITSPFYYQEHMTKTKAIITIIGVWFYSFIWSGISTFSWQKPYPLTINLIRLPNSQFCVNNNRYFYMASYFVVTLVPLVVMAIAYVVILKVAFVQIRAIRATEVHIPQETPDKKDRKYAKMSKSSRRTNRELRATATLAIVYGAFFVCWFPPCIINIVIGFQGPTQLQDLKKTNIHLFEFIYYTFMEVLPTLSTAINPIIYNVFNRQFRTAFKAVFLRMARKSDVLRRTTMIRELDITTNGNGATEMGK